MVIVFERLSLNLILSCERTLSPCYIFVAVWMFPFWCGGMGGGGGEGLDYFAVIVPTSFKFISYPYKRKTDLD